MADTETKKNEETKAPVKTEETKAPEKTEETKAPENADRKKDILDDIDEGDLILQNERESIPLTPENAVFTRSKGGLISLSLKKEDGETEEFERVVILRAFPVTNPTEFLSVREGDGKQNERGHEIGMVRRMSDFDGETQQLFLEELDRRYFTPVIKKITNVKEKFGFSYWEAQTTAGNVTFILNNPFNNIRVLDDGRVYINDLDGNSFLIPDPKKLDPYSYRKIEVYL